MAKNFVSELQYCSTREKPYKSTNSKIRIEEKAKQRIIQSETLIGDRLST